MKVETNLPDPNSFPDKKIVVDHMTKAVSLAAISAHVNIQTFTHGVPEKVELPKQEKDRRTKIVDKDAYRFFMLGANSAPYRSRFPDGEGDNEIDPNKLGEKMPFPKDEIGAGREAIDADTDLIDGTYFATHNWPNAISLVGVSTYNGITEIPIVESLGRKPRYFRKLFASPEFRDILSLEKSAGENLEEVRKLAGIKPENITFAAMKRECNSTILKEAREFGAKIELIEHGDVLWGLSAMKSSPKKPIITMGRGGAPEGAITIIAARALGATGQLRVVEDERNVDGIIDTTPIFTPDEFITGGKDQSMVIFSAITKNTHFNLNAVKPITGNNNNYTVETLLVDSSGFHSKKLPSQFPLSKFP